MKNLGIIFFLVFAPMAFEQSRFEKYEELEGTIFANCPQKALNLPQL